MSELQSAYLYAQNFRGSGLKKSNVTLAWNHYFTELLPLDDKGKIDCPKIQSKTSHNAHRNFIKRLKMRREN